MIVGCWMAFAAWAGCDSPADVHHFSFETMGTVASGSIEVWDKTMPIPPERIVATTFDSVAIRFSRWRDDSEIGRLNTAPADSVIRISEWLSECLRAAESLHAASDGAFDVTVAPLMKLWGFDDGQGRLPSTAELDSVLAVLGGYTFDPAERTVVKHDARTAFDLGGIAKGYAVDRAVANLIEAGVSAAMIDLGGNLFCLGIPEGRDAWQVGLRDPLAGGEIMAVFAASHRAAATCGAYERFLEIDGHGYGHILDPATGLPAEGLLSVTVIGRRATMCDGLSTALFVAGPDEAQRLLRDVYNRYDAVLVLPPAGAGMRARVLATRGLEDNLRLRDGFEERYSLEFMPF